MIDWICRLWLRLWIPIVTFCSSMMLPAANRLSKNIVVGTGSLPKHKDTLYRHSDQEYQEYRDALFEQSEVEYRKLSDKQYARRMQTIQEVQAIIDNSSEVQHFDGAFPQTYRNGPSPEQYADRINRERSERERSKKKSKTNTSSKKAKK